MEGSAATEYIHVLISKLVGYETHGVEELPCRFRAHGNRYKVGYVDGREAEEPCCQKNEARVPIGLDWRELVRGWVGKGEVFVDCITQFRRPFSSD
jgi:hypothetical protein